MASSKQPSNRGDRVRGGLTLGAVGLVAFALILSASAWRDHTTGDRFDLLRWERLTLPGAALSRLGAPARDAASPDDALSRYFTAESGSADRERWENAAEAAIAGRIDAILEAQGVRGAFPTPRSVFPPVAFELAASPRVLVQSPRNVIRRASGELLRPDLDTADAAAIERDVEARDANVSALVVGSGGVAAYPAIVAEGDGYADTLAAAAHEWMHHYLTFYPLGMRYFEGGSVAAMNETVADLAGDEIARLALERWGDPTRPAGAASTSTPEAPRMAPPGGPSRADTNAVLRDLRREVDALLAAGKVADAEARMEAVRQELATRGVRIRRINQAYFAWYGTYTARPDSIDPLGGQLRELRQRSGSLAAFLEVARGLTSRADVQRELEVLRARGG